MNVWTMTEDNRLHAVRDLMRELNELDELRQQNKSWYRGMHNCNMKLNPKKKKLEHLKDVRMRKQQPKQIKTQKKEKNKK